MKREILFKAKRVDNKGWVQSMTISTGVIKRKRHLFYMEVGDNVWVQIIPETVCQFTGLLDKNKNKIFEGDAVNCDGLLYKIIYDEKQACFIGVHNHTDDEFDALISELINGEVVFNIHD